VGQQLDVFISETKFDNQGEARKNAGEKAEARPAAQSAAGRDGVN
jgi:hypothetical protein